MSDQNWLDEIIQKYLHCWSVFLAACGRLWEKIKTHAAAAADFLRRNGKLLARKLAAWLLKAREWLKKTWAVLSRRGKVLLQKLAAWALKVREQAKPKLLEAKAWAAALPGKVRQMLPAKAKELPPAEAPALPEAVEEAPAAVVDAVAEVPAAEEVAAAAEEETQPEMAQVAQKPESRLPWMKNPTVQKVFAVLGIIGKYVKLTIKWIWKLRTIFMAIPVVWAAIRLAMENMVRLPDSVGLDIQASGEFAQMISREQAVYGPLLLTAFCLLLMFCSKKPLLPWVVSIFTLVMPVLIWVLNSYA